MVESHERDVDVERKETKSDPSKVGVALIKYATYLIIFFGIIWVLINYIFPMF